MYLLTNFVDVTLQVVPRELNGQVNILAQQESGLRIPQGMDEQLMRVQNRISSIKSRGMDFEELMVEVKERLEFDIIQFLKKSK